jgi:hypothetical protein
MVPPSLANSGHFLLKFNGPTSFKLREGTMPRLYQKTCPPPAHDCGSVCDVVCRTQVSERNGVPGFLRWLVFSAFTKNRLNNFGVGSSFI